MQDLWTTFMQQMGERVDGPMKFRFVLQPLMAAFLAYKAGMADAKAGRAPYFWSLFSASDHRREIVNDGWKGIGKVFILALVLDIVYQLIATRAFHPGQGMVIAVLLALIPYLVLRGVVTRIARK